MSERPTIKRVPGAEKSVDDLLNEFSEGLKALNEPATLDDVRDSILLVRSSVREATNEITLVRLELAKLNGSREGSSVEAILSRINGLLIVIAIMLAGIFGGMWRMVGGWPF